MGRLYGTFTTHPYRNLMKSTDLLQLVDNLHQAGKIHNLQRVCGVSGCGTQLLTSCKIFNRSTLTNCDHCDIYRLMTFFTTDPESDVRFLKCTRYVHVLFTCKPSPLFQTAQKYHGLVC